MHRLIVCWVFWSVACSNKKVPLEPSEETSIETLQKDEQTRSETDCPEGVKTPCNVSSMTAEEISKINEANRQCVESCVASRRVEAMSADVIQNQCQQSCDSKHFVGQVQIVPSLEEIKVPQEEKTTSE